jgi:hypothetical protein
MISPRRHGPSSSLTHPTSIDDTVMTFPVNLPTAPDYTSQELHRTNTALATEQAFATARPIPRRECTPGDKRRAELKHLCAAAALRHSDCKPHRVGVRYSYT